MLVEVGVSMSHGDVDVGHLDAVVVPQMFYSGSVKTM